MERNDLPHLSDDERDALDAGYVAIEGTQADDHDRVSFGPYTLDNTICLVYFDDTNRKLTVFESKVLAELIRARGQFVSKTALNVAIYTGGTEPVSNGIEVIISRLRRKIGTSAIRTKRLAGYAINGGTHI
jgi:two-component system OmpR family response regulator